MQQTLAYQGKASSAEIPRAQRRAKAKSLSFYTSTFQEDPKQGMLAAYATGDYTLQAVADAFGMQSTEIKVKLAP